jgi:hypothetical protein
VIRPGPDRQARRAIRAYCVCRSRHEPARPGARGVRAARPADGHSADRQQQLLHERRRLSAEITSPDFPGEQLIYLIWHLRRAWAPLTYTDEHPPARANPVDPARRSPSAQTKASYQHDQYGHPYRSFRDLLDHLATLTRDTIRVGGQAVDKLVTPTPVQRRAFDLIGAPIPLTVA